MFIYIKASNFKATLK